MRETAAQSQNSDFSRGSVAKNILRLAVPMTVAQLIHVLYSVVDRMYLGHIPGVGADALTGVGITFPILTIITAFANLFGMGGSPLFSIERGKGDAEKAKRIMGNTFAMLLYTGLALMAVILLFKKPLLYAFGAQRHHLPLRGRLHHHLSLRQPVCDGGAGNESTLSMPRASAARG